MTTRHPGKIKRRLSEMLKEHSIVVDPYTLKVNHGYNNAHWDCCTWNGTGTLNGRIINVFSYMTMTELVRRGIVIWEYECGVELFAKD